MGEGKGKASKAPIYLESILSPRQAEKKSYRFSDPYKTLWKLLENAQVSSWEK